MKSIDLILQDVFDVIKIIAIPLIGFFLYQFYNGVTSLKKSVDKLIIQMQAGKPIVRKNTRRSGNTFAGMIPGWRK